jgi:ATP-dependent NAD(P)H-hydrate dehydratase
VAGDMGAAIRRLVPPLSYGARKGQMGRIGVLGGSADFTGAPFYAGMASLKASRRLCMCMWLMVLIGPFG